MQIHRHFVNNHLRNYNYLLGCPDHQVAMAIDPLDHEAMISLLEANHYQLIGIINTHEHADHTDGNLPLLRHQSAPVYAHHRATNIPGFSIGLQAHDCLTIGNHQLTVMDTPGHTAAHVCLFSPGNCTKPPSLLSGDTIFNAGVGNCSSGSVDDLFRSTQLLLERLPDDTRLYPGHDYLENNCRFALSREPENLVAAEILSQIQNGKLNPADTIHQWSREKQINPFFRLDNRSIREQLVKEKQLMNLSADAKDVFAALRKCRDNW